MLIREGILKVLTKYKDAMNEEFKGHVLANFLRHDFPHRLKSAIAEPERYLCRGGPGLGRWTKAPWVAVFDVLVTTSAESGYYPAYLFPENFHGVYLSLNQGVTEIRRKYRADAKEALKAKAADFRAQLGDLQQNFPQLEINLAPSGPSNLSAFYQAGNICAKYYPVDAVPDEGVLVNDLHKILTFYEFLSDNETLPTAMEEKEDDAQHYVGVEDLGKFRQHKRIDRNPTLVRKVKKIHGYTCEVCGFSFERTYGDIGRHFIEAHHLTPIAELKGKKVSLDPRTDFSVVCSNCHQMLHKFDDPGDIERFKKEVLRKLMT